MKLSVDRKKTIISIGICLSFAEAAIAALGENEAQMAKRYGQPGFIPNVTGSLEIQAKYHVRQYLQEPYLITACFDESGLVAMEEVKKIRAYSLNNSQKHVAQEFSDQEIQEFLGANESYDGPFVEKPSTEKGVRVWITENYYGPKASAALFFREETFKNGEKDMIQILQVATADWSAWSWDYHRRTGSRH
jgi:hypothetical protein